jgi:long-chain acyl-CoA synthetase
MANTIPEAFFEVAGKFPEKVAFLYKRKGFYSPIKYKEVAEKIQSLAFAISQLGIKKDSKVAILSENRPEWAMFDLAIMSVGGISVPLHIVLCSRIIEYILNHCQAEILIVSNNDLLEKIISIQDNLPFLKKIIFLDEIKKENKDKLKKKAISYDELLTMTEERKLNLAIFQPDDICSIVYTSGTTGLPKGVELSHHNFLSNVEAVKSAVPVQQDDVFLSFLPLSHILERTCGYYIPLLSGSTIAYAESAKTLLLNLSEVRPTILISAPRIFEKFYEGIWNNARELTGLKKVIFFWALKQKEKGLPHILADILVFKKIKSKLGGRLRLAVSGGASLDKKIAKFFKKIGVLILEGYGLTETSPVIAVNKEDNFKFGTVGKPVFGANVKIYQDKEILTKGANVMKGYFNDIDETKNAIDFDGWFHTGDLGFIDEDGYLTIIGRKKEMIVTSGGKNVWPEVVERELNSDAFITQSIVIGNNKKFISALVVPEWEKLKEFLRENNLSAESPENLVKNEILNKFFGERIDGINKNFSDYEKIKKFQLISQEFSQEKEEMTPTLKLRRKTIEDNYKKQIEEMYA